ncbi:hypothetical protein [Leptolyngbya sp. FACHB-261]|uniref:hypothetical protein n=1 Tax=Leptolyngbya sp. FACHB-261 TaxID=2692806 RepID=UPI0016892682|nr:hypothetical protein [Leptolyngbya sp. FACHB-261]MBD2099331.1 hypothetical protein [Leptolyngbya sp. FACHB-261]
MTPKSSQSWSVPSWTFWASLGLLTATSVGTASLLLLLRLPPKPDCSTLGSLTATDSLRIYCARSLARQGDSANLMAALQLIEQLPPESPLHNEARQAVSDWSEQLLRLARQQVQKGDLQSALSLLNRIPNSAPNYARVSETRAFWQQEWRQGQQTETKVIKALRNRQWDEAQTEALSLSDFETGYWREGRLNRLLMRIAAERTAWGHLEDARRLAAKGKPAQLAEAIELAKTVGPERMIRATAQGEMNRWGRQMLAMARQRFQQKDLAGAVEIAQSVPGDLAVSAEAQDFAQLTQARALAQVDTLLGYLAASATARQIKPGRPLYAQANTQLMAWHDRMPDLARIDLGRALAGLDRVDALKAAIRSASGVEMGRPYRSLAQTLIASWRKDIEVLEDQPIIEGAQQLARNRTVADLQAAIETAGQIRQGRVLFPQAKRLIAGWRDDIEVLQDQPILDQARGLARRGALRDAIAVARRIRRGRALYPRAQASIGRWQADIREIADRNVLDRAYALADEDRLERAIATAEQIGSGSRLAGEAQAAIDRWYYQLYPPETPAEPEPEPAPEPESDGYPYYY